MVPLWSLVRGFESVFLTVPTTFLKVVNSPDLVTGRYHVKMPWSIMPYISYSKGKTTLLLEFAARRARKDGAHPMKQVAGSHKKPDLPIPPDMASWKVRSTKSHRLRPSANVPSTALAGVKFPCP